MRIRSLKPEFFKDRVTGRWPADLKMFYAGLWVFADDEGRFEWEPDLIRCELFPYDPGADVEGLLARLLPTGKVVRYQVGNAVYGAIPSFSEHQHPDKRKNSKIPAPPSGSTNRETVPDASPTPPRSMLAGEDRRGEEGKPERSPLPSPSDVIGAWNEMAGRTGLPKSRGSDRLKKTIRTRMKSPGWLDAFLAALSYVEGSDWTKGANERGWRADLEWLLRDGNAEKYADRPPDTKRRKESPEDAAVRAAWEESERFYTTPAAGDGAGRGDGPGDEGDLGREAALPPLPDDGPPLLPDLGEALGARR